MGLQHVTNSIVFGNSCCTLAFYPKLFHSQLPLPVERLSTYVIVPSVSELAPFQLFTALSSSICGTTNSCVAALNIRTSAASSQVSISLQLVSIANSRLGESFPILRRNIRPFQRPPPNTFIYQTRSESPGKQQIPQSHLSRRHHITPLLMLI